MPTCNAVQALPSAMSFVGSAVDARGHLGLSGGGGGSVVGDTGRGPFLCTCHYFACRLREGRTHPQSPSTHHCRGGAGGGGVIRAPLPLKGGFGKGASMCSRSMPQHPFFGAAHRGLEACRSMPQHDAASNFLSSCVCLPVPALFAQETFCLPHVSPVCFICLVMSQSSAPTTSSQQSTPSTPIRPNSVVHVVSCLLVQFPTDA